MTPKSVQRFSEKVMLKQEAKAKWRFNSKSFRFSTAWRKRVSETGSGSQQQPAAK
jgi:hypothetical protein